MLTPSQNMAYSFPQQNEGGGELCMKGGIYSEQRCQICGSRFKDNRKNALICPEHQDQKANKLRVYFKGVSKRFSSYVEASRCLTGWQYETDKGSFDARDYMRNNPLGFENLALQWLKIKEHEIKYSSYRKIADHIGKAVNLWHNRNVKEIRLVDFQYFLASLSNLSDKTKHYHLQSLKQFFKWLYDNEEISRLPKFPEVKFSLAYRNTISKDVQQEVINEVYQLSKPVNLKIWFAVKLLSTYISIRPNELLNVKERDIDLKQGFLLIPHPKERKPKLVPLLDQDIEIFKTFPKGLPDLYFFRNNPNQKGTKAGKRFNVHLFYDYWKRACRNLGVEGVDLYGGTRHSSARALRKHRTPEQIKLATGHKTSKAFERYFTVDDDYLREIYQDASGKTLAKGFEQVQKAK